jgi:hypothetical protein
VGSAIENYKKYLETKKVIANANGSFGRDVLRDYLGNTVPTLMYGTNGTMIKNASLSSQTNGLLGTINLLGGSFKQKSTLTASGLQESANNLPMRLVPAQLSVTSVGCPLAEPYQAFFIDFGTGTTLDNIYTSSQVAHSFSPGRFETSWTFIYSDGYGKFYSATSPAETLKRLVENTS